MGKLAGWFKYIVIRFRYTGYRKTEVAMRRWVWFTDEEVEGLDENFVGKLDSARGFAGVSFVITSGYRTPERNKAIGGVENSAHTRGRAADVRCRDSRTCFKIVSAAIRVGINRIGVYTDQDGDLTHCHLDDDGSLLGEVIWVGISK